ncbi:MULTISPECIES: hypothetical protein [unclassified Clostridium]|uniref:hypothetical protein n=1 Tax=unclassified Clostridium TaxID=2614128 RepID=UPI0002983833|nr:MULTISPECIES: hypothetical protein [unclassified Clostridium]EKQ51449.1 MAG: hypothetical protein A370_04889 [Clostridium sp. Maddingley MBC34-26]
MFFEGDAIKAKLYVSDQEIQLVVLEKLKVVNSINEHGTLIIEGVIPEEQIDSYGNISSLEPVKLILTDHKKEAAIFHGLVYELNINCKNKVGYIYLKGISYSYLLDIVYKSRSFQNKNILYQDLIDKFTEEYEGRIIKIEDEIMEASITNKPYIEYQETDWQFLKRMSSAFNCGLYNAINLEGIRIQVGPDERSEMIDITEDIYEWKIEKNFEDYKTMQENYKNDVTEYDYKFYKVKGECILQLGKQIVFRGMRFFVAEVNISLKNSEICFEYLLKTKNGVSTSNLYNEKLVGSSIEGSIIKVEAHDVWIHLDIDKTQSLEEAYRFPFSSISSSPNNVGWYFMPEIGDRARLYFGDNKEENAIVTQSVPIEPTEPDPNVRYMSTVHDKQITLAPGGIYITSNKENLYIKLDDGEGISIYSNSSISINAGQDISISSGTTLEMSADTIHITGGGEGGGNILINENVTVTGKQVSVNEG